MRAVRKVEVLFLSFLLKINSSDIHKTSYDILTFILKTGVHWVQKTCLKCHDHFLDKAPPPKCWSQEVRKLFLVNIHLGVFCKTEIIPEFFYLSLWRCKANGQTYFSRKHEGFDQKMNIKKDLVWLYKTYSFSWGERRGSIQGRLTEGECSVQLSSLY